MDRGVLVPSFSPGVIPMSPITPEEFIVLKKTITSHFGFPFKVVSDSMRPVLEVGTLITIEKVTSLSQLQRFDMIAFRSPQGLMVHFVWHHNSLGTIPTVTTRSLKHSITDDLPVDLDSVMGRVTSHQIPRYLQLKINLLSWLRRNR